MRCVKRSVWAQETRTASGWIRYAGIFLKRVYAVKDEIVIMAINKKKIVTIKMKGKKSQRAKSLF